MTMTYNIEVPCNTIAQAAVIIRGIVDNVPGMILPGDRFKVEQDLCNGSLVLYYRGKNSEQPIGIRYDTSRKIVLSVSSGCDTDGYLKELAAKKRG